MFASPLCRLLSATTLGLALLILPSLTSSTMTKAYAGDSRRFDNDDHRGNNYGKKFSKKHKRDRDDDDDDNNRRRFRNRRSNNNWWYQQNHRSNRWSRAHHRHSRD